MAVKSVIQIGHLGLRKQNKQVVDFKSPKIRQVLKDLKDTVYKTGLIGIAAPQINANYQIFVTHARNTKARKLKKPDIYRVFINPKITYASVQKSKMYEGCGSVVNGMLFGQTNRSQEVEVHAFDENGRAFSLRCDGILAKIIQHEFDHLHHVEFIQKIEDYSQLLERAFYEKNIRSSQKQKAASEITKIIYKKLE